MYSLSRDHKPTDIGQQNRILKAGGKIYRTEMFKINHNNNTKLGHKNNNNNNNNK